MAACGASAAAEPAASGAPALSADDKKVIQALLAMDWGKCEDFKGDGITGKIWKATMDKSKFPQFPNTWVKSDKTFTGAKSSDYQNYSKFMAETTAVDTKTVKAAENTHKNADGTVSGLYVQFKMGTMISNRDMHLTIKSYAVDAADKLCPDDMKCDEVSVWKDMESSQDKFKAPVKKVVRMKVVSYSFGMDTDAGYRTVDFDNYDFGGSLPKKITAKFVGNKADFITMAKDINTIKKNGGVWK